MRGEEGVGSKEIQERKISIDINFDVLVLLQDLGRIRYLGNCLFNDSSNVDASNIR